MKTIVTSRRIGIMGGTFDPIHYGHLMLAEQIKNSFYLDEILFIPVGRPYHKQNTLGANAKARLKMTTLAVQDNPSFSVSDIEVKREMPTYTVDTIKTLKSGVLSQDEIFFITGADAIYYLDQWKDFDHLKTMVTFIGATRPGVEMSVLHEKVEYLVSCGARVELCTISALAISSTEIRERIQTEKTVKYLLPDAVVDYIEKKGLYKSHHPKYDSLKKLMKTSLSKYRYNHSINTSKICRKLAHIHGENIEYAELAGLCHDYMKELDNSSSLELIEKYKIEKDFCIINNPNLAHGEIAAEVLCEEGLITEIEILNAIRWHTYGHETMAKLDKIVFIADVIEPSRSFEGIERIRHLAYQNLDQAVLTYLDQSEAYLKSSNKAIHQNAVKLRRNITNEGEICN